MKKTILIAMALVGVIAPCAVVAQAAVAPHSPPPGAGLDWWLHQGRPPAGFVQPTTPPGGTGQPFPAPVPQVNNRPHYKPFPTPVPQLSNSPLYRPFPNPIPQASNPPLYRPLPTPVSQVSRPLPYQPHPFAMPPGGTGVPVSPPPVVLLPPTPSVFTPLVIAPFAAASGEVYPLEYADSLPPPEDVYSPNLQPASSYDDPVELNGTPGYARMTFDDWEIGISGTPVGDSQTGALDWLLGFHLAYAWSILYFSWDSIAVPNYLVQAWTGGYVDSSGNYVDGYSVPGFLNLWDAGLRLILKPVVAIAEAGVNALYVYQLGLLPGLGANLRLGAGLKFGFWGISVTGTSVYQSWSDLASTVGGLFSSDTQTSALNRIAQSLVPSFQLTFYF